MAARRHKNPGYRKLPSHSYKEVMKRLCKLGMSPEIQKGAKHPRKMRWPGSSAYIPIPAHNPVAKGTLKDILRRANITLDQYLNAK